MLNPIRVSLIATLFVVLLFSLAACGGTPAATPATPPPATDGSAGVLDGAELVDTLCTTCHTREKIDAATKDLVGWQTTIDRMISQNGAKISDQERSAIAIYLSNR